MENMEVDDLRLIYVTASSREEAETVARHIVEAQLAACANVFPGVRSFYRWKGALACDDECVVVLKTRAERVDEIVAAVGEVHSYELPCIVALPIVGGHEGYLQWVASQVVE